MSVDLRTRVGSVELPNPVMTASGTAGHGAEFQSFFDLADLGAHVVKSLAAFEWAGNPAPRVHPAGVGMINAVGLQGPGVAAWMRDDLPALVLTGARIVVSIWGRSVEDYRQAAALLADAPPERDRRRSQPVVSQPGGSPRHLRPRPGSCLPKSCAADGVCDAHDGPSSAPTPTGSSRLLRRFTMPEPKPSR